MSVLKIKEAERTLVRDGVHRHFIHGHNLMTVVIEFDNGPWEQPDPYHHHEHEQTTYIASGQIIFMCEGEKDQTLMAGDMFYVPPNKKHTIQLLSQEARLVDSFNPVREDFL